MEIATAIWGALICHTWKARNGKQFKSLMVQATKVINQIQEEVQERIIGCQKCTIVIGN